MTLSKQILGAWKLVSYVEEPVEGEPHQFPLGLEPTGLILYTTDGFMSAQLMKPGRMPFSSGDVFNGTPKEHVEQGSGYMAYSGPYLVDETHSMVTHCLYVSLFPNWLGGSQMRIAKIDGDTLEIRSKAPFKSGGKFVHGHVTWRRASAGQLQ
jgi:Lipocalin-like domain